MRFMLFAGGASLARAAAAAGVERVVVDLERRHKRGRQHGYHLECGAETLADLRRVRRAVRAEVVCRINPVHRGTAREVSAALAAGADALMLPMFKSAREARAFLALVAGRAKTILLFETRGSLADAGRLDPASFDEVYVGLNDLAIDLGVPFCYSLLRTPALARLRRAFPGKPFGFGGVTVADGGAPLPTRLIAAEQERLGCTDVILRRAFKRDVRGRDLAVELSRLRRLYAALAARSPAGRARDRRLLADSLRGIVAMPPVLETA